MNATTIEPYLFYGGRCDEALAFYAAAIGAQVEFMMRYSQSPEPLPPGTLQPGFEDKVMHSTVRIGAATFMASDGCNDDSQFSGFSLALGLSTVAEVDRAFAALAVGGRIQMPPTKTFWSPRFGMLTDPFGVAWMVSVADDQPR